MGPIRRNQLSTQVIRGLTFLLLIPDPICRVNSFLPYSTSDVHNRCTAVRGLCVPSVPLIKVRLPHNNRGLPSAVLHYKHCLCTGQLGDLPLISLNNLHSDPFCEQLVPAWGRGFPVVQDGCHHPLTDHRLASWWYKV